MPFAPSAWSVDAIEETEKRFLNVRVLRYHPEVGTPIGQRYLMASRDVVSPLLEESPNAPINFGRTFRIPWGMLSHERGAYVVTPNNIGFIERAPEIEDALGRAIGGILTGAESATSLDTGGRSGDVRIDILNVGQGDTILVELPNRHFWLIDAYAWHVLSVATTRVIPAVTRAFG